VCSVPIFKPHWPKYATNYASTSSLKAVAVCRDEWQESQQFPYMARYILYPEAISAAESGQRSKETNYSLKQTEKL